MYCVDMVQSHLEEPGAGIPHAGICAGAWGKPHAYCVYGSGALRNARGRFTFHILARTLEIGFMQGKICGAATNFVLAITTGCAAGSAYPILSWANFIR